MSIAKWSPGPSQYECSPGQRKAETMNINWLKEGLSLFIQKLHCKLSVPRQGFALAMALHACKILLHLATTV